MTELKLLQGGTVHRSRHEGGVVGEGSRGGYPPDPDTILRYPGNVLVGPSDNRVRICESESEEGVEVNEPVSARTNPGKQRRIRGWRKASSRGSCRDSSSATPSTPRSPRTPKLYERKLYRTLLGRLINLQINFS